MINAVRVVVRVGVKVRVCVTVTEGLAVQEEVMGMELVLVGLAVIEEVIV